MHLLVSHKNDLQRRPVLGFVVGTTERAEDILNLPDRDLITSKSPGVSSGSQTPVVPIPDENLKKKEGPQQHKNASFLLQSRSQTDVPDRERVDACDYNSNFQLFIDTTSPRRCKKQNPLCKKSLMINPSK
jgi:hypothetical protein